MHRHIWGEKRARRALLWEQTRVFSAREPGTVLGGGLWRRLARRVRALLVFRAQRSTVSEHNGKPLAAYEQGSLVKRKDKTEKGRYRKPRKGFKMLPVQSNKIHYQIRHTKEPENNLFH